MSSATPGVARILGQVVVYAACAAAIGYFSYRPAYRYLPPDTALVRLSFSHAGARKGECRRLTPEEIAELAPNMRRPMDCPRERVPLLVELEVDGAVLYREFLPPTGLAGDGSANVYERFEIPAGRHAIEARLRDTAREEGFDWSHAGEVRLEPGESFVVDFNADTGGFRFL